MALTTLATALDTSAQKYAKELLMLPGVGLTELLPYMTGYPGVTYKQTIGELFASSELRPYNGSNNEVDTTALTERTLETFLGSVVELFDPNALKQTVWAQLQANGNSVNDATFAKAQLMAIMDSILYKLGPAAWSAVRNGSGTTTAALFNGFDTITAAEIIANNITTALGNLYELGDAITNSNAVDAFRAIYKAASPELKAKAVNIFVDPDLLIAYEEDYLTTVGASPYNQSFEQATLLGTGGRWKFVPMVGKAGSGYVTCSTKQNMVYGYGNGVAEEKIEIRRGDNAFKLQFILAMFFGVQFATVNKRELLVAKLVAASS